MKKNKLPYQSRIARKERAQIQRKILKKRRAAIIEASQNANPSNARKMFIMFSSGSTTHNIEVDDEEIRTLYRMASEK